MEYVGGERMKILHVKIKGMTTAEVNRAIKKEIEEGIKRGYLLTDEYTEVEVLEFDGVEVKSKKGRIKYQCLDCKHTEVLESDKQELDDALICPECKGLLVDVWQFAKYKHLKRN